MAKNQEDMLHLLAKIERQLSERADRSDDLHEKYRAFQRTIDWYVAAGSHEIQRSVLELMRFFRPRRALGFDKTRLGSKHDGGYVLLNDFQHIDTALSFGIERNADWDMAICEHGIVVYQFDHTIDYPPIEHPGLIWEKKMIAPTAGAGKESIASLVERHDKRRDRPNMILKMDIEGAEWEVFNSTPVEKLGRFTQVVCEFHAFEFLGEAAHRASIVDTMSRLTEAYSVIHVHANNFGGFANVSGVVLPTVLEVTFANKAVYRFEDTHEVFPGPLDAPCDPHWPDLRLGTFTF